MTEGMLAREALGMLGSGAGSLDFETGLCGGLLDGAARGLSEVLSELDGELEAPSCGRSGSRMHRRGALAVAAVAAGPAGAEAGLLDVPLLEGRRVCAGPGAGGSRVATASA